MISVTVLGAGVWGPGLRGWAESLPVLQGHLDLALGDKAPPPPPSLLSPTERRRAGLSVRLALAVATEASGMAGIAPGAVSAAFGTSNGDGPVVHAILSTLASPEPQVSPTQFHNSVHNAASGYWSIGAGSQQPAVCIAAHDCTFAATLLKAASEAASERRTVLLCVYDTPMPPPLDTVRQTSCEFAAALVIAPGEHKRGLASLRLCYASGAPEPAAMAPRSPALAALAERNPAARSLRLLETLALGVPVRIEAALLDGRLEIDMQPCSTGPR